MARLVKVTARRSDRVEPRSAEMSLRVALVSYMRLRGEAAETIAMRDAILNDLPYTSCWFDDATLVQFNIYVENV